MRRFFFHLERDGERVDDDEGVLLADGRSAELLALKAAGETAAEDLTAGSEYVQQFVIVEDDRGQELLRVRVEARLEVRRRQASG